VAAASVQAFFTDFLNGPKNSKGMKNPSFIKVQAKQQFIKRHHSVMQNDTEN